MSLKAKHVIAKSIFFLCCFTLTSQTKRPHETKHHSPLCKSWATIMILCSFFPEGLVDLLQPQIAALNIHGKKKERITKHAWAIFWNKGKGLNFRNPNCSFEYTWKEKRKNNKTCPSNSFGIKAKAWTFTADKHASNEAQRQPAPNKRPSHLEEKFKVKNFEAAEI